MARRAKDRATAAIFQDLYSDSESKYLSDVDDSGKSPSEGDISANEDTGDDDNLVSGSDEECNSDDESGISDSDENQDDSEDDELNEGSIAGSEDGDISEENSELEESNDGGDSDGNCSEGSDTLYALPDTDGGSDIRDVEESSPDHEDSDGNSSDDSGGSDDDSGGNSSDDSGGPDDDSDGNSSDDNGTLYSLPNYVSKNGKEVWERMPLASSQGRRNLANVLRQRPGPTRYAIRECDSVSSSFLLFFRPSLLEEILKWSNKEGQGVYGNQWVAIDTIEMKKFLSLLECTSPKMKM